MEYIRSVIQTYAFHWYLSANFAWSQQMAEQPQPEVLQPETVPATIVGQER